MQRVTAETTANGLACGLRGLEAGRQRARVRLRERDRVRYAAGVRAGRRARRCSSAMWRNSAEDCRPNRRAALSALCPAGFIVGFSPKLCTILEKLIITNL